MMKTRILIVTGVLSLFASLNASAASCTDVKPDASGQIIIHEHVPQALPLCYAFRPPAGQQAKIEITTDDSMGFGLEAVAADGSVRAEGDNHHSHAFTTDAVTYHVYAGPASLHGDTSHEFTLMITLK